MPELKRSIPRPLTAKHSRNVAALFRLMAFMNGERLAGTIPFAFGMKDDRPFAFAGLWEGWKDPATGDWLRTFTIITGDPNELVAQVHTRMPVILAEEHHAKWLGEIEDGDLKELLKPYPADEMKMWSISQRVNSPKNDDPSLVEPLHAQPSSYENR